MAVRRVAVTGLGAVSPVGNSAAEMWQSLREGRSGIGPITLFDASAYGVRMAGEVKGLDLSGMVSSKELRRMDRFVRFAIASSDEALKDSGIDMGAEDPDRVGVVIGSGIGGLAVVEKQHGVLVERGPGRISPFFIPMLIVDMASGQVSIRCGAKGPNSCTATACASGAHAIGDSFRIIQHGEADVMIAGGTEAAVTPLGVGGFCAMKALSFRNDEPQRASRPFDRLRDGFVIGEGAGILVLEELGRAKARGAEIYAEVLGYGRTGDAYHITAMEPGGDGAARAMKRALDDARLDPSGISYINAHGTSTPINDRCETQAIKRTFGDAAKKVPVSSTKSMTGHLLGASGGIEAVACVLAIRDGVLPPTINYEEPDPECDLDYVPNCAREAMVTTVLSNSLGFGGHNASIVFGTRH